MPTPLPELLAQVATLNDPAQPFADEEFSFTLGGVHNTEDGVSPVLAWSFDTDKIKQPLFSFLETHGWKRKKALFG